MDGSVDTVTTFPCFWQIILTHFIAVVKQCISYAWKEKSVPRGTMVPVILFLISILVGAYVVVVALVVVVVVVVVAAAAAVVRTACTRRHYYKVTSAPPSRQSLNHRRRKHL